MSDSFMDDYVSVGDSESEDTGETDDAERSDPDEDFDPPEDFDAEEEFDPEDRQLWKMNISVKVRRYMEENLSSPDGATLMYLNEKLELLESSDSVQYFESGVNIDTGLDLFVLKPKVNYPYRLFRIRHLRVFKMKYVLDVKSWKLFLYYLKNTMNLSELMPLLTPGHSLYQERNTTGWRKQLTVERAEDDCEALYEFHTLWTSGIDVEISINNVKLLVIEKDSQSLLLNRLKKSIVEMIIVGLAGTPVLHVHLDHVEIDDLNMIPNDHLESLVLFKVKTKGSKLDYVRKCRNLRQFYCLEMNEELVDFSKDLHFTSPEGPTLVCLGLGNSRITCSIVPQTPIQNSFVTTLELNECQLDSAFVSSVPKLFPRLKNLKFKGIMSLKLLYQFLLIESIEHITIWKLEMTPHLVACADSSLREMKQKIIDVDTYVGRVKKTIKVIQESVLSTVPWKDSKQKQCDQTWSYDLHATEDPQITEAMKMFLIESSRKTPPTEYVNFNQPICEAFEIRRLSNKKKHSSSVRCLKGIDRRVSPCSSKHVKAANREPFYWESLAIHERNREFPFYFSNQLGWVYPYPNETTYFGLEGLIIHDVDAMDELVQNTVDYYNGLED